MSRFVMRPEPCLGGGTCDEHDGTFPCYCRPGLTGSKCEHDLTQSDVEIASFTGVSAISIKTQTESVKRIEIDLIFKPLNIQEGILYYSYNKDGESSDFISIAIIKNHIEFRYDLGDRPVSLKSHRRLRIGEWHHVVAKRYHRDGLLEVDRGDWITGSTKGSLKTLNLVEISWVGGTIPSERVQLNAGTATGFNGCIKELKINRKSISLTAPQEPLVISRKNIIDCLNNPCIDEPCHNDGLCHINSEDNYHCECQNDFTGIYILIYFQFPYLFIYDYRPTLSETD